MCFFFLIGCKTIKHESFKIMARDNGNNNRKKRKLWYSSGDEKKSELVVGLNKQFFCLKIILAFSHAGGIFMMEDVKEFQHLSEIPRIRGEE